MNKKQQNLSPANLFLVSWCKMKMYGFLNDKTIVGGNSWRNYYLYYTRSSGFYLRFARDTVT